MKNLMILIVNLAALSGAYCQVNYYQDDRGKVAFYSKTPIEDISAYNNQVLALVDLHKGTLGVMIPMKGFTFRKTLMEEHFNDKYVESDKYPKASFTGAIANYETLDVFKPAGVDAIVVGEIKLHGVSKPLSVTVHFQPSGKSLKCTTQFKLKPADFNIKIPRIVMYNIAEEVEVTAEFLISKKQNDVP